MQSTHLQVPIKNLRPGHEAPNHPGNARVTGREDGIAELAAHIHARGKIDDLLVYEDGVPDIYFVANGNRSLAALRMIYGEESSEPVSCKLTTPEQAFEDSLAVAVTAKKFHPVDEYEGFARLLNERGKTEEEIARQYGKTLREVQQALALGGSLSPQVRDLWREGLIETEVVHALPMVGDHKAQDALLKKLAPEGNYHHINSWQIKQALKIDDAGVLVEFVGVEAYVKAGGKITRDLFGVDHKVSDPKLAKKLAGAKLEAECASLVEQGWSWALPQDAVKNHRQNHSQLNVPRALATAQEQLELDRINRILPEDSYDYDDVPFGAMSGAQQQAYLRKRQIEQDIAQRPFTAEMKAKAGCFLSIDPDGLLEISFGWAKAAEKAAATRTVRAAAAAAANSAAAGDDDEAEKAETRKPEPAEISNALRERIEAALVQATKDALLEALDTDLLKSPLSQLLARLVSGQINVNGASVHIYSHGTKEKLPAIRDALPAALVNAAIAKRFDADDYFRNAPKKFVIKAITEAVNADEARKAALLGKADLVKFAMTNVAKAGWLPKELRTPHYVAPAAKKQTTAAPSTREAVKNAKAARDARKASIAQKRVAKKTAKKKR